MVVMVDFLVFYFIAIKTRMRRNGLCCFMPNLLFELMIYLAFQKSL